MEDVFENERLPACWNVSPFLLNDSSTCFWLLVYSFLNKEKTKYIVSEFFTFAVKKMSIICAPYVSLIIIVIPNAVNKRHAHVFSLELDLYVIHSNILFFVYLMWLSANIYNIANMRTKYYAISAERNKNTMYKKEV